MNPLSTAIEIAVAAHADDVDKQGKPYILHPLRVMLAVEPHGLDAMIIGVLHDVIEDHLDFDEQVKVNVSFDVYAALLTLVHRGEPYHSVYLARVQTNELARVVKIADMRDNLGRLDGLPERDRVRLGEKYRRGLELLGEHK